LTSKSYLNLGFLVPCKRNEIINRNNKQNKNTRKELIQNNKLRTENENGKIKKNCHGEAKKAKKVKILI